MKKIFVTGATGFIGSNLVKKLIEKRYQVYILQRKKTHPFLNGLDIQRIDGDILNYAILEKYIAPCDAIIHLAALISFNEKDARSLYEINVVGTKNILRAAGKLKKRVVIVSSASTIGKPSSNKKLMNEDEKFIFPQNSYAHSKYLEEQLTLEAVKKGLDAIIVNPSTVYGAGDMWGNAGLLVNLLKKYPVYIAPSGGCSVIAVQDVASGIIAALEKGRAGKRYILTAENISFKSLFEVVYKIIGTKRKIISLPKFFSAIGIFFLEKFPLKSRIITPAVMENLFLYRYLDNSKAKKELQWSPVIPLEQAIREMLNFQEQREQNSTL